MKEKQKESHRTASEYDTSDPSTLHLTVIVASANDVISTLDSPSQHARVTVARAVEVGELEQTGKDDTDGVAVRGKSR